MQEAFDKNQQPLNLKKTHKTSQTTSSRKEILQPDKGHLQNPIPNIILYGERLLSL